MTTSKKRIVGSSVLCSSIISPSKTVCCVNDYFVDLEISSRKW